MKLVALSALVFAISCQAANADDPINEDAVAAALQQAQSNATAASQQTAALASGNTSAPTLQSLAKPFVASLSSDEQTATVSGKVDIGKIFGPSKWNDYLVVTAQTPVSQGSNFANVATLDGLSDSSSVEVRLSMLSGGSPPFDTAPPPGFKEPYASWIVTFDGKVGTQSHQYYDPTTLMQQTSHTTSWQAGGSVGTIFGSGHASFNLSFDYQEFYQDGDTGQTRTQCLTPDDCVTGFIGAPLLMHSGLLSSDLRWIGKIGPDKGTQYPVGLEVKVTYDPIRDAEAVQVPIYFATDDKGLLTGGVRYDWQSDSHVSTIGVFVSSAFSLGSLGG